MYILHTFHKTINRISQLQTFQTHSSHLAEAAMSDHKEVSLGKCDSAVTFYIFVEVSNAYHFK